MDLYRYRLIFFFLLFFGCEQIENNLTESISSFQIENSYTNYSTENNELSIYLEISNYDYEVESVQALIINPFSQEVIAEINLLNYEINPYIFTALEVLDLSDEIYIFTINYSITFSNDETYIYSSFFTTPTNPEIINYTVPTNFQLDSFNWSTLPLQIEVLNLNGIENIEIVKYEVQRILNGCEVECEYDINCNQDIVDEGYQSDETWFFNYVPLSNDDSNFTYLYHADILMRPLNGDALFDEQDNIIFSESDCGRTGLVLFKLFVSDKDGLSDEIIDLVLEITD
ncbi:hypothetical protein N9597_00335 [Candidatus Marinimicrobia bacterium]|nr:hypothetical protein [Candidatus Neomarinimicrobiota bacterium]